METIKQIKKAGTKIDNSTGLDSLKLKRHYGNIIKLRAKKFNECDNFIMSEVNYYHGTFSDFKNFSVEHVGKNTGRNNAKFGIFFLDNKKYTQEFLEITKYYSPRKNNGKIKEVGLCIKNPLDLTLQGIFNNEAQAPLLLKLAGFPENKDTKEALTILNDEIGLGEIRDFMESIYSDIENKQLMIDAGYDGIVSQFGKDESGNIIKEYVAFYGEQIFSKEHLVKIHKKVHNSNFH